MQTIGREDEVARVEAALEALAEGNPGCIAITGEPGIGKTHLLRDFRRRAEERGNVVLSGTGSEFESEMPYGIVRRRPRLLRRLARADRRRPPRPRS